MVPCPNVLSILRCGQIRTFVFKLIRFFSILKSSLSSSKYILYLCASSHCSVANFQQQKISNILSLCFSLSQIILIFYSKFSFLLPFFLPPFPPPSCLVLTPIPPHNPQPSATLIKSSPLLSFPSITAVAPEHNL